MLGFSSVTFPTPVGNPRLQKAEMIDRAGPRDKHSKSLILGCTGAYRQCKLTATAISGLGLLLSRTLLISNALGMLQEPSITQPLFATLSFVVAAPRCKLCRPTALRSALWLSAVPVAWPALFLDCESTR